ncbi:hypothetical protein GH714_019955 [Hevea brasiliensis]|uniref:Uncharacterized protein n=1 Tax=Hevea brasiliensis TaxID=3981 RepID=A0A6A6K9R9_HEVBR|nr:hypothetical protein GH714_019955 [Hevea brasiliensis]
MNEVQEAKEELESLAVIRIEPFCFRILTNWGTPGLGFWVLGVRRSGKKEFLSPEKGLLSRIEVGLMTASAVSEKFLKDVKPANNLGKELGFLYLSVGDRTVL